MEPAKPFAVHVIVRSLIVAAVILLTFVVETAASGALAADPNAAGLVGFVGLFAVLFVVAAFLSWRENKWGFLLAGIAALLVLLLFGTSGGTVMENPADYGLFARFAVVLFLSLLVTVYGFLAFRNAGPGLRTKPSLSTANSAGGMFTYLAVGIIVGALVVGFTTARYIDRIASNPGVAANITIVRGAYQNASGGDTFVPSLFSVTVDTSVTWRNGDLQSHTVTSSDSPRAFDSGEIPSGSYWSHSFTAPGTYGYFCIPHPYMTGEIVT
jgi:plastocyanin